MSLEIVLTRMYTFYYRKGRMVIIKCMLEFKIKTTKKKTVWTEMI